MQMHQSEVFVLLLSAAGFRPTLWLDNDDVVGDELSDGAS